MFKIVCTVEKKNYVTIFYTKFYNKLINNKKNTTIDGKNITNVLCYPRKI